MAPERDGGVHPDVRPVATRRCSAALSLIASFRMAQLIVRRVEDAVVKTLRRRAAERGVSMEEEHRRILRSTLLRRGRDGADLKVYLDRIPPVGTDEDFARPRSRRRRVDL